MIQKKKEEIYQIKKHYQYIKIHILMKIMKYLMIILIYEI